MPTKAQLELKLLESEIALNELKARGITAETEQAEIELRYLKSRPTTQGLFNLTGVIAESSVHSLMDRLETWANAHPASEITLAINSQGGNVLDGFALYDYLQTLKKRGHKITTSGMGLAASMASVLLQAGDVRVMSPRTWLVVHEVQAVVAGSYSEMEDDIKLNGRLQEQAIGVLLERSTWTRKKLTTVWKRKDCWLNAEEALAAGFIDRIES